MAEEKTETSAQVEAYVTNLIRQRKADYTTRNKLVLGIRRQRFMRNKLALPKAYQALVGNNAPRAPLTYRLIQTAVGAIAKVPPEFHVVPRQDSDKDVAERAQDWCKLMLNAMSRSSRRPIFWKMLDSIVGDGGTAVKIMRRPWNDFPAMKESEDGGVYAKRVDAFTKSRPTQPFVARVVDWATFYPPTTEWGEGEIVEHGKRPTQSTLQALRLVGDTSKGLARLPDGVPYPVDQVPRLGPTIEVSEVWNDEACFIVIENEKVLKLNNIYGKPPYVWSHGLTTSSYDPALEGVSVAFGLQYLQPWIDTMLGIISAWSILGGTPIMWTAQEFVQGMPTDSKEIAVKEIPFGKWVDFGIGGKGGYMEPPGVGQAIIEAVNLMVQMADRVSLSPVASGFLGTRTPGLALSAAMEAATANLTPIVDNAQNLLADMMKFLWHCVQNVVQAPVYVNGLIFEEGTEGRRSRLGQASLAPADIPKLQDCLCELEAQTLQDQIAAGTHATFMNRDGEGLWTRERSMRFSGVKEPDKEERGLTKERVLRSPLVQQYLEMLAVADQPPLQMILAAAMAQAGQPGGAEAPAGRAETPANPPGAPRNIGGPAPRGGGRPSGSSKLPGGPGRAKQGRGRMT